MAFFVFFIFFYLPFRPMGPASPGRPGRPGSPWDPVKPSVNALTCRFSMSSLKGFFLCVMLFTFLSKRGWSSYSWGAHLSISTPLSRGSLCPWFPCPERREWLSSFSFSLPTERTLKMMHPCCPLVLLVPPILGDPSVQEHLQTWEI